MVAAITGLAVVFNTSALAFQTLKYMGVAYLLYMAWNTLRDTGALGVEADAAPRSARRVITTGVLVNILNPKLTIFFFAFLPQFVNTVGAGSLARMLQLSAMFMLLTFVVFVGYGLFAVAIRTHVITRPQVTTWIRRVFGAAIAALAVRLAFTDR